MERIEISTSTISLSEIVRHVSRERVPLELTEGQVPVARIIPVENAHSMAELDRALRESVRLGEDSEAFARDVLSVRKSVGELDDPRES